MKKNKSKACIAKAIYELLQTEQIQNIKTTDIIERADISPKTFYNHFKDKYDVCYYIYDRLHEMYIEEMGETAFHIIDSKFECTQEYLLIHKNFILNTLCYMEQNNLADYCMNLSYQQWLHEIEEILGHEADKNIKDALYFTIYGQTVSLYAMLRESIPMADGNIQYHKLCLPKILEDIFYPKK